MQNANSNPQSAIRNPQSAIRNPQSAIRNPQSSPPHFRFPELLQQQFLERGIGTDAEEMQAARLAELAQALDEVLHGLLIGLEAVTAEGDLLDAAGFRVHQ